MEKLQAPEYEELIKPIRIFLAGGITDCPDWQSDVIEELESLTPIFDALGDVQLINPRNSEFDVTDKTASLKQIKWEHYYLDKSQIISYFFCKSESIQPITLYELGRYRRREQVITIEKGYKREEDVLIQSALDSQGVQIYSTYKDAIHNHALRIATAAEEYYRK